MDFGFNPYSTEQYYENFLNEDCLFETPLFLGEEKENNFQSNSYPSISNNVPSEIFKINSLNNCNFQNCQVSFNSEPKNQTETKQEVQKKRKTTDISNDVNKKVKFSSDDSLDSNHLSDDEKKAERRNYNRISAQNSRARHKIELNDLKDCQDSFIDLGERVENLVNIRFLGTGMQSLSANKCERVNYYKNYIPEIIESMLNRNLKNVNNNEMISPEIQNRIENINHENNLSKQILEERINQLSLENAELRKQVVLLSKV